jgi:DNA invertase Pin-like site-specific DNA recombinase
MKVALYARVSTRDKQNPELQLRELKRYCHSRGLQIAFYVVDKASGSTEDRTGLKRILESVRRREIDGVVVLKLDRLFRSLKHLITTLEEFEALGVKLIAVRDQVDMTTPSGRLFIQVIGALGEFERELIRERVIMGLENAKAKGVVLGRPKLRDDKKIRELRQLGKRSLKYQKVLFGGRYSEKTDHLHRKHDSKLFNGARQP